MMTSFQTGTTRGRQDAEPDGTMSDTQPSDSQTPTSSTPTSDANPEAT